MAKAIFEPGQKKGALAGGTSVYNEATDPIPQGNSDPNRQTSGKAAEQNNTLHLSGRRQLFYEDLSGAARTRIEEKHRQFQQVLPHEVTKASADPGPPQVAAAGVMSSRGENSDAAALRIARESNFWGSQQTVRQPSDPRLPGSGWYFSHNEHYRTSHPGVPNASDGGSVMSPLNSPDNEKMATEGLLRVKDKHVTITTRMAADIRRTVGQDAVDDRHIGVPTQTKHLDPRVVKYLSAGKTAEKFPRPVNAWAPQEDRDLINRGGTNVTSGALILHKGKSFEEITNPQSAPKVYNYGLANRNFVTTKAGRRHYDQRASAVEDPQPGMIPMNDSQVFKMTSALADHVLDRLGRGTEQFDPEDRAVKEVVANSGRQVHMDFAHPAIVQALADLGIAQSHPRVHAQALASMNHPIVADSWMNAIVAGQPQATVLPRDDHGELTGRAPQPSQTSVLKEGGAYWPNMGVHNSARDPRKKDGDLRLRRASPNPAIKAIDQDEPVLDVGDTSVYDGGSTGLMHAFVDRVVRRSARSRNIPSVAAQESDWTVARRVAGRGMGEDY